MGGHLHSQKVKVAVSQGLAQQVENQGTGKMQWYSYWMEKRWIYSEPLEDKALSSITRTFNTLYILLFTFLKIFMYLYLCLYCLYRLLDYIINNYAKLLNLIKHAAEKTFFVFTFVTTVYGSL